MIPSVAIGGFDSAFQDGLPVALVASLLAVVVLTLVLLTLLLRRRDEQRHHQALLEHENRLNLALWGAGETFWDYDLTRDELTMTSHARDEMNAVPSRFPIEVHPDDLPLLLARLRHYLSTRNDGHLTSQHRVRYGDRDWHWIASRGRAVKFGADGRVLVISGTARDISQQRAQEQAQRIALEVFENMSEAVAVLDAGMRFVSVNGAFSAMTGHLPDALLGQSSDLLYPPGEALASAQQMREALIAQGQWAGELWHRHRDGHDLLCQVQAVALRDEYGDAQKQQFVLVLGDVTEQRRVEKELRQLANYDVLTELPNRSLFNRRLSEALGTHRDDGYFAVLFLDLDRFKDINDSMGHAIGDQVLRAAAQRLRETVTAPNMVARLGGDEFTVLLEHIGSPNHAYRVADAILSSFSYALQVENGLEFSITPSIGISVFPEDGRDADTLVRKADTAMYQAKSAGRQRFCRYHTDMEARSRLRVQMSAMLRGAIERGEMSLVYQPRWNMRQERYSGVEALLRWQHPELGTVSPATFIPLAEETGMIVELGNWVANEACQTLTEWNAAGVRDVQMAINVSSMQLLRDDFPDFITRCLDARGLEPRSLEIEITESVLMDNPRTASERLQRLRALGIRISIDDFGTGYSSLSYLRGLPIHTLKVDRAFVTDLSHEPRDQAIIIAVITMAHSMGMDVIAEGVESEVQLQFLNDHGCDEAQGYHLAPPLSYDECLDLLLEDTSAA